MFTIVYLFIFFFWFFFSFNSYIQNVYSEHHQEGTIVTTARMELRVKVVPLKCLAEIRFL